MKRILTFLLIVLLTTATRVKADEGMWLLPLIEKLNIGKMTELGFKLTAEDIYSLNKPSIKDAIVIFGGGCTGEIVSSEGLILTNHHCGYSTIQSHSTVEHDYLTDGFWAMSKDEEIPSPGLAVTFLVRIEDVTTQVLAKVNASMSESERSAAINQARSEIAGKAVEGTHYTAQVYNFYYGNDFYLIVYERFNDIRFVGAPPSSIGKYGSDTDNWEWPRHTGDFSVFRVYSGPDGKPAPYSKENVPLKPKHWLPVSLAEINKGDFAMIMGYPGGTQRYYTSHEVNELMTVRNPVRIKVRGIKQDSWMEDMKADNKVNIQYANKYFSSSNYWKYSIGQNLQLEKLNVTGQKIETEKKFNEWVNADNARKEKYGNALNLIKNAIEARAESTRALLTLNESLGGCEILGFNYVGTAVLESLKQEDAQKTEDLLGRIKGVTGELYKDYNPPTDKKTMKLMLEIIRNDVPSKYHPDFFTNVIDRKFKGDIGKFVDNMFAKSVLSSEAALKTFLEKPSLKILTKDPVILTSESISKVTRTIREESSKFDADLAKGQRLWMAALREMEPEKTQYPEANFTMRLTYGTVQDYDPRDAVTYKHFTTLKGVVEKYKPGDYEFDLPERLIKLQEEKNYGRYASDKGHMPVCFLTTNDITGGNSGSPVMNDKGELIGLAFDGNWEAMSGDVAYEPTLQRTIVVDIRYVLWVIDVYAGAGHLVKEMTVRE